MGRETLIQLILSALRDTLVERSKTPCAEVDPSTRLYGEDGLLDSLGIATLVMEIEARLDELYEIQVVLTDDRAMSRSSSPFATLGSLINYVEARVQG